MSLFFLFKGDNLGKEKNSQLKFQQKKKSVIIDFKNKHHYKVVVLFHFFPKKVINIFFTVENVEYQEIVIRDPSSCMDSENPHPTSSLTHFFFLSRLVVVRFTGGFKTLLRYFIKCLQLEGSFRKVSFKIQIFFQYVILYFPFTNRCSNI